MSEISAQTKRYLGFTMQEWAEKYQAERMARYHLAEELDKLRRGSGRRHWIATTPGGSGDIDEVAWTEQTAQEYRDAGWTVEGPFA